MLFGLAVFMCQILMPTLAIADNCETDWKHMGYSSLNHCEVISPYDSINKILEEANRRQKRMNEQGREATKQLQEAIRELEEETRETRTKDIEMLKGAIELNKVLHQERMECSKKYLFDDENFQKLNDRLYQLCIESRDSGNEARALRAELKNKKMLKRFRSGGTGYLECVIALGKENCPPK